RVRLRPVRARAPRAGNQRPGRRQGSEPALQGAPRLPGTGAADLRGPCPLPSRPGAQAQHPAETVQGLRYLPPAGALRAISRRLRGRCPRPHRAGTARAPAAGLSAEGCRGSALGRRAATIGTGTQGRRIGSGAGAGAAAAAGRVLPRSPLRLGSKWLAALLIELVLAGPGPRRPLGGSSTSSYPSR